MKKQSRLDGEYDDLIFDMFKSNKKNTSIIKKSEKTIQVKGTAKRKAHKRVIKVTGKVKDSIPFEFLDVTGLPEIDQKISHCIHDFDKRIAKGEDMREAVKLMVNAQSKMYYTKSGIDEPRIDTIMGNLGSICCDSNKGLVADLNIHVQESGRSNYVSDTIYVSRDKNLSGNIFHETGHHLEASKRSIHQACVKFHDKRTLNEPEVKLDDLIPNVGYKEETTKPDRFIHPYVGKIYPYMASTEILSYGLEKFTTNQNMKILYDGDREHFALVLSCISGRI